jgi:hypothetical protein
MIIKVCSETTTDCACCGQVACERDLYYVTGEEAEFLGVSDGEIVCTDCAELKC